MIDAYKRLHNQACQGYEATVEYLKEVRDWLKDETDADRIADILKYRAELQDRMKYWKSEMDRYHTQLMLAELTAGAA